MTPKITNEYLAQTGYLIEPAPVDDWRHFDENAPVPAFFQFDWFSARHPDLYHKFALSTEALMDELERIVDLTGQIVADIGAGTGRGTLRLARKAKHVFAIDPFKSVLSFNQRLTEGAGLTNVTYQREPCAQISLPDNAVDAAISSWAVLDYAEAYRILKPGGYLIFMGSSPGTLCGELTATLASEYPTIIDSVASADVYDPAYPTSEMEVAGDTWNGVPLAAPLRVRDFTFVGDYGTVDEAVAVLGRFYGPKARAYFQQRAQSSISWRLRIEYCQIAK